MGRCDPLQVSLMVVPLQVDSIGIMEKKKETTI